MDSMDSITPFLDSAAPTGQRRTPATSETSRGQAPEMLTVCESLSNSGCLPAPDRDEQLCRTQTALTMMALFTMRFLEARGLSAIEWIRAAGEDAAQHWTPERREARVLAQLIALNAATFGAELVSLSAEEDAADLVFRFCPPSSMLSNVDASQRTAKTLFELFRPTAVRCGYGFEVSGRATGVQVRLFRPSS